MKSINALLTLAFVLLTQQGIAQVTQLELMSGAKKTDFTSLSIRPLDAQANFSLGTLAFFQKYHQKENTFLDEAGVQPTLYWNIKQSLSIGPGIYYNSIAGFSERLSLLYKYRSEKLIWIAIPTIAHAEKREKIEGELFMQIQFTQPMKEELKLILLAQLMTSWQNFKTHNRSFQQIRLGVEGKSTQFGLAMDHDLYGNAPLKRTAIGLFVRKIFLIN